jgi:hypothetical protein
VFWKDDKHQNIQTYKMYLFSTHREIGPVSINTSSQLTQEMVNGIYLDIWNLQRLWSYCKKRMKKKFEMKIKVYK